ncbi:MAG: methyltransferase domain-containing protein [Bacteroidota bacterium]
MIEAKHLKLILAIAETGSISKASKQLHLTQSALSHQLKKLEDQLDLKLFHRVDNQLIFTQAGKEFRNRADSIQSQYDELAERLREIKASQLSSYIHGYSPTEAQRLQDQATTVADFLHHDAYWPAGSRVLEVGCGVGAQTEIIARQNPEVQFLAIDIAADSLRQAERCIQEQGLKNVRFRCQDVRDLPNQQQEAFDHIFICFLLEHLPNPLAILQQLKRLLKPTGTITLIEGDHGSTFFYPDDEAARKVVAAQVDLQKRRGGNANIGRALHPLLSKAGYAEITVSPRQVYVDASKPQLVEGFIKNTFTAMIQGMAESIVTAKLLSTEEVNAGIAGLLNTAEEGVFSYTFFKAEASLNF